MDDAEMAWSMLVSMLKLWAEKHMDQWEMVQFPTEYGTVYVTISRHSDYPDSFTEV